jgi:hypothetical protein
MKRTFWVCLFLFLCSSLAAAYEIWSFAPQHCFVAKLTNEALDRTPFWKETDNPPLSAKVAIRAADKKRAALVKDTLTHAWSLTEAALVPDKGKWYWRIRYELYPTRKDTLMSGRPYSIYILVLMDGTVVEPLRRDWGATN